MLSSEFFNTDVANAINDFRESHTGTLSGMTRFIDHLDDMPAEGYAHSAIALRRGQTFYTLPLPASPLPRPLPLTLTLMLTPNPNPGQTVTTS